MTDPQPPPSSVPPASTTEDVEVPDADPIPAAAEDRKAAAALSALDAPADDAGAPSKSDADTKALGEAMNRLELLEGGKKSEDNKGVSVQGKERKEREKREEAKKKVKVEAGDVAMLVEHLELSKAKATELLKSHEGSVDKALRAYVTVFA